MYQYMKQVNKAIEREIIIGLIVSTDYLQKLSIIWDSKFIQSTTARLLGSWCWDYFEQYHHAPNRDIQKVYTQKLKEGLDQEEGEGIERILEGLSEQYEDTQFNVDYLLDQTKLYFTERRLTIHKESLDQHLENGDIITAEQEALTFQEVQQFHKPDIDITTPSRALRVKIKEAFQDRQKPLLHFPKALGQFWNRGFTRDGFVALLAPEKRGKTYMLMEIGMRGVKSKCHVAFFQAGDMTEKQQLRRIGIYLARRSDDSRYCKEMYIPVVDCIYNQLDECDNRIRECSFGIFSNPKEALDYDNLVQAFKDNPDYTPCHNCDKIKGSPWLRKQNAVKPLTWKEMYRAYRKFQNQHKTTFRLSTHANSTLSIAGIKSWLNLWERQDQFIPNIIIIDYADILALDPDMQNLQTRHQENEKWKRLRGLSQERHCLVVTATLSDTLSYDKSLLSMANFSEDKRKHAHVTAEYGLNQTPEEKKIGIVRINEIVLREGAFDSRRPVTVLQRLQMGRPFIGSYF